MRCRRSLLAPSLWLLGCFADPPVVGATGATEDTTADTTLTSSPTTSTTLTDPDSSTTFSFESSTTAIDSSSTTTGDPLCPGQLECRPHPAAWTPVVRGTNAGCPMGTESLGTFSLPPLADCACGCMPDPSEVQSCALLGSLNVPDCTKAVPFTPGCNMGTTGDDPNFYRMSFVVPPCISTAVIESSPGERVEVCTPQGPATDCGENSWCAPQGEACVARDGVHECPPNYATRAVLGSQWHEPECSCDSCEYSCPETVELHTDTKCSEDGIDFPANGKCSSLPNEDIAYSVTYDDTATCMPGMPSIAQPSTDDPYTLCCDA